MDPRIEEARAVRAAIVRAAGLDIFTADSPAGLAFDRLTGVVIRLIMARG